MKNPFESGHIKNYVLFYVSVVIVMILFFMAATLLREEKDIEKKVFMKDYNSTSIIKVESQEVKKVSKFKLLDKAY